MTQLILLHCCHNSILIKLDRPQLFINRSNPLLLLIICINYLCRCLLVSPDGFDDQVTNQQISSTAWHHHTDRSKADRYFHPAWLYFCFLWRAPITFFVFLHFFLSDQIGINIIKPYITRFIKQTSTQCTHNFYVSRFVHMYFFTGTI